MVEPGTRTWSRKMKKLKDIAFPSPPGFLSSGEYENFYKPTLVPLIYLLPLTCYCNINRDFLNRNFLRTTLLRNLLSYITRFIS